VEVTAVTHRRDAIYPTTIVGAPPMEDYYLGKATERVFLPLLKTIVHDIEDYHLPMFGCFHNCAAIQVRKAYPLQGRRVMHSVWGAGQMAWTKMILVVDEDVDIHDEKALLEAVLTRCDFRWDLEHTEGPLDILDQAAPELGAGGKIGFDATRTLTGDRSRTRSVDAPEIDDDDAWNAARTRLDDWTDARVACPDWGARRLTVVGLPAETPPEQVEAAMQAAWNRVGTSSSAADLLLVVDDTIALDDFDAVLFEFTACADPGRDLVVDDTTDGRRIGFDATSKAQGEHPSGARVRRYAPKQSMPRDVLDKI
jgi:4-hydroxy-3-polyprenylbenzoate decarboxylase